MRQQWDAATEIRQGDTTRAETKYSKLYPPLTNLIKPLMDIVDSGRIAFTPAVERFSYLPHELQDKIVEIFERRAHAVLARRRLDSEDFWLRGQSRTADTIEDIMAKKPKSQSKRDLTTNNRGSHVSFLPP